MIIRPVNKDAKIGETIVLQCSTNETHAITWRHTTNKTDEVIFKGKQGFVDVDENQESRLNISFDNNGKYDLVITNVQQSDAGEYECYDPVTEEKSIATLDVSGD